MSADYEAVLKLAATAAGIKVAHAAMAAADPTIFEFSTQVEAQHKQIVASLATRVDGVTIQSERYARTQCLMTGARMIYRWSTPRTGRRPPP
jgi:hypothetical protein